ncbi:erythromycin esterase family protein [Phytoactinopolyspora limicola]|uniref:erythromycin esterase family protein n=1 Tax=Phytoactinopolyspora limicola TaxID=2715536 RepID=UPI001409DF2C|nr:erythromycin esterase family protein [Phytoactinopolyspora limicola]
MNTRAARRLPVLLLSSLVPAALIATTLPALANPPPTGLLAADAETSAVVAELDQHAQPVASTNPTDPLDDLEPFGDMIGEATIIGVGEATHGSHEFRTLGHRLFRYLVDHHGFSTVSAELSWSTGLRLNHYVLTGQGDVRRILTEELQREYSFFRTAEIVDLLEWMRAYNERDPDHPIQIMGNDIGYAGPEVFDEVLTYIDEHHPALRPRFERLYTNIRPQPDQSVENWMDAYMEQPRAQRQRLAIEARLALWLLQRHPGPDPEQFSWAVQNAMIIHQITAMYMTDFWDDTSLAEAMLFRDRVMAENTVWWHEHTGDKIMVFAHNGHIAYESYDPPAYPKVQGAFFRDLVGDGYVNVGTSFGSGSFNAWNAEDEDEPLEVFTLGPADEGSNEHLLDQVQHPTFLVDLRQLPETSTTWLRQPRPTRVIGTGYPLPDYPVALEPFVDIVLHLDHVDAADIMPTVD